MTKEHELATKNKRIQRSSGKEINNNNNKHVLTSIKEHGGFFWNKHEVRNKNCMDKHERTLMNFQNKEEGNKMNFLNKRK